MPHVGHAATIGWCPALTLLRCPPTTATLPLARCTGTWLCLKSCTAPQAFYDDSDPSASSAAKRCSLHIA